LRRTYHSIKYLHIDGRFKIKMANLLKLIFFLAISVLAFGCSKDTSLNKESIYCEDARIQMISEEFYGWLSLYPNNSESNHTIHGYTYVSQSGPDSVALHIKSETTCIDTIILFPVMCKLVENDIPCTVFLDTLGTETGSYSNGNSKLTFSFLYGTCQRNSYFEGLGRK